MTCETCRYWGFPREVDHVEHGNCRRHAPLPQFNHSTPYQLDTRPIWPQTMFDDWCGEYAAKEANHGH